MLSICVVDVLAESGVFFGFFVSFFGRGGLGRGSVLMVGLVIVLFEFVCLLVVCLFVCVWGRGDGIVWFLNCDQFFT